MVNNEVGEIVKTLLVEILGAEVINNIDNDEYSLINVGLNSLTFIKLVLAIEEQFSIAFDDEDLVQSRFSSINDFIDYIQVCLNMNNLIK